MVFKNVWKYKLSQVIYSWFFFYTNINWASTLKKSSCLYWWYLVKNVPASAHSIIVSQRSRHSMGEAEMLSTSRRKSKKGKVGLETAYYIVFIARQNFCWIQEVGYFFFFLQLECCIVPDIC